jgi:hypothetical protein
MARTDADVRDYVSLAALRDGYGDRNPWPIPEFGLLACALAGPVGPLVMFASEG